MKIKKWTVPAVDPQCLVWKKKGYSSSGPVDDDLVFKDLGGCSYAAHDCLYWGLPGLFGLPLEPL